MTAKTNYRRQVAAAEDSCDLPISGLMLAAMGEFNRGEWFECHETLEELWHGTSGEVRDFYQGTLQLAVALNHWRNANFAGAVTLLKGGMQYLRRVRPVCQRVDVAALVTAADAFREELERLGPQRMGEIAHLFVPKMRLCSS